MEPRTSDRYFNTLSEVNYADPVGTGHGNDRLKEPLSFNSKFESGNLNYVLKVTTAINKESQQGELVSFIHQG
jgi:hypothetical protein